MKRLTLKFGGTSLGTIEKIKKVADIIKKRHEDGNEIIVIVSAMSGATNELKLKSELISKSFDNKELDVLRDALNSSYNILAPKGRLVLITYHSLVSTSIHVLEELSINTFTSSVHS